MILQHFNIISSCVLSVSFLTAKKPHALPHSLRCSACFHKSVQHFTSIFFHSMFKLCIIITSGTLDSFSQGWPKRASLRSVPFSEDDRTGDRRRMEDDYRQHFAHVPTREHKLIASAESIAGWHLVIFLKGLHSCCCMTYAGNLVQKFTAVLFLPILGFPNNILSSKKVSMPMRDRKKIIN